MCSILRNGLSFDPANYELVCHAPLMPDEGLEDIYTLFNIDWPVDFTGHSLSVSDIVILHEDGQVKEQGNPLCTAEMAPGMGLLSGGERAAAV